MPTWLTIALGVWSGIATLLTVVLVPLGRWLFASMRELIGKVERIDEHMSPHSELSRSIGGTLPERVQKALARLDEIDRRISRLDRHDD